MSDELPVTGYFDRFSCRPGGSLGVHVSLRDGGDYRARLVRVISGDPNPAGPGMRFVDLSSRFDRTIQGRRQAVHAGSYGRAPAPRRDRAAACTWSVMLWTAAPPQSAAVLHEQAGAERVTISVASSGVSAELAWDGGAVSLATTSPIRARRWYRVWLAIDPGTGNILLGQQALESGHAAIARAQADGVAPPSGGCVLIAAEGADAPRRHFTGKLEAPTILRGFVEDWHAAASPDLLACWDFAQGIDGAAITDIGPQACHGALVNLPTRAVVGARWSGRETCWRHAPEDYAAIHFHADDIDDCRWEQDFRLADSG